MSGCHWLCNDIANIHCMVLAMMCIAAKVKSRNAANYTIWHFRKERIP